MQIDILSIFPDYLSPLDLSLSGKARAKGLLDIKVHDLRRWATDRHHTTDDTPYGGGAGMVMRPEPFGAAFDDLDIDGSGLDRATIIFTTPSGAPFSQEMARELATKQRLVFACGRYEGIDQRVIDHAATRADVREISIGDYVLNGGEVAALAITEAVVRLLPGFMGNPDSLSEESHEDGLLEYPVFTKPAQWRGLEVPPVLLSGNHAAIAQWRQDQAVRRTAARRPDLLHGSATVTVGDLDGLEVRPAQRGDAGELLTLQRACWLAEGQANPGVEIPALGEALDDVVAGLAEWTTHVVRAEGRLIAACRGRLERSAGGGETWDIGRLMIAPDLQGRGLGRWLLEYAESLAPDSTRRFSLFTGEKSAHNLKMYRKAGYRIGGGDAPHGAVFLSKRR